MRRSLLTTDREERRGLTLAEAGVSVRADDDSSPVFKGHAAVFDTRTTIGNPLKWGWYEEIAPGAFTKTLSEGDARMLIDHDSYYVVARVSADTLRLAQDKVGLAVEADLDADLSYVADLTANLRNGNITGMSFGFWVEKDIWTQEEVSLSDGTSTKVDVRRILEVRLLEVSSVTFPAYEETDAGLRQLLVPVLRHRNSPEAIARAIKFRPELADEFPDVVNTTEPGETTRAVDEEGSTKQPTDESAEPAETTQCPSREARMRALAARYHLPAA